MIQNDVKFKILGLVIIDEQHRFGVNHFPYFRKRIEPAFNVNDGNADSSNSSITYHGDMDLSIIDELPVNRIPVTTKIVDQSKMGKVYEFIRNKIKLGRQAIVVYPLVEESGKVRFSSSCAES